MSETTAILMYRKITQLIKDKFVRKGRVDIRKIIPHSFDVIGSREKAVAIVEIRDDAKSMEKKIAELIMKRQKNVKSVLKKVSERKGEERIRELELIGGDENTEVLHKEYGYSLKVDPKLVYFSPREAAERQRVADKVKPNEIVLVMFSGICPFSIAIAKKQPRVGKVISIEINKHAHKFAEQNIKINKVSSKVIVVLGDVRKKSEQWFGKCDRVLMPLPLDAENFLDVAVKCLKERGAIHFYSFGDRRDPFAHAIEVLTKKLKKFKFKIIDKRIISQYSPGKVKVCLDVEVKK